MNFYLTIILICILFTSCQKEENETSEIISIEISGESVVNQKLTLTTQASIDKTMWLRADDANGTNAIPISNSRISTYTVTKEDLGKFIIFEATLNGVTKRSNYIGPIISEEDFKKILASTIDKQLFVQIKAAADVFKTDEIWDGYKLADYPIYLIHKKKSGAVDKGFIINPLSNVTNASKVSSEDAKGLDVYRYDEQIQEAISLLNSSDGNGLYKFDFEIDGEKKYYLQVYTDQEVVNGENKLIVPSDVFDQNAYNFSAIGFIIHECFHIYQDSWDNPSSLTSAWPTKEELELRILTHEIFKDFPNGAIDINLLKTKLKQYIAIREKELEIASEEHKETLLAELSEGTAKFIESMAVRKIFPNRANEPFELVSTSLDSNYKFKNQEQFLFILDQLHYDIGSSVCYGISKIDKKSLKEIESGKTPFQIIKGIMNLKKEEINKNFEAAKASANWKSIQNKAAKWSQLK